jgi:hypothetical protein
VSDFAKILGDVEEMLGPAVAPGRGARDIPFAMRGDPRRPVDGARARFANDFYAEPTLYGADDSRARAPRPRSQDVARFVALLADPRLTLQELQGLRRDFARRLHPDRAGGALARDAGAAMARVNALVDRLIAARVKAGRRK